MAATVPQRVTDLIHRFGWDAMARLSALGIQNLAEAQVLFVDSGATNTLDADDGVHGLTIETPLATIDYAVGLCTASEQSIIIVAPGHAETEAAAAALVTCDIAGVKIIGMGCKKPLVTNRGKTGLCRPCSAKHNSQCIAKPWTKQELEAVKTLYQTRALLEPHGYKAIRHKAQQLGVI